MPARRNGSRLGAQGSRYAKAALGVPLLALAIAAPANAATFTPTTFDDDPAVVPADCPADAVESNAEESCSLREAIGAANDSTGDDEVVLAAGTYLLDPAELGALEVAANSGTLLVRGAGARATTIDGNSNSEIFDRVFDFEASSVGELRDLGVTGGASRSDGGGIIVRDTDTPAGDARVTLTRMHLFGNGSEQSGAGIANRGKLTVVDSLIDANSAGMDGGGIENDDELTVTNSTISNNDALGVDEPRVEGGDVEPLVGDGGGVHNTAFHAESGGDPGATPAGVPVSEPPFARFGNSTITGNDAAGNGGGVATVIESGRGATAGFVFEQPVAPAHFHNTIVSGNSADGDENCSGNVGEGNGDDTSSEGYNLEDGTSCLFTSDGDLDADPVLGPLADNGGGTATHALGDGSKAIDGGEAADCPAADQRGVARPQRSACDIGAFEREPDPVKEEPQSEQQQPAQGNTQEPDTPRGETACLDTQPPLTSLKKSGLTVSSTQVKLSGTSAPRSGPCPSPVERVEVSLARVNGGSSGLNCRFIRRSNRFVITPFRNCRQPVLFRALGTTNWTFTFKGRLPKGKYRAQARGYNEQRLKETPKKRQNIIYFRVK